MHNQDGSTSVTDLATIDVSTPEKVGTAWGSCALQQPCAVWHWGVTVRGTRHASTVACPCGRGEATAQGASHRDPLVDF